MLFLKKSRDLQFFFFSWGTIDQVLSAKNETDSVPYVTVLGFLLYNSFLFLKKYGADDLTWNTALIIVGDSPFKNLNISIAKVWIFLWSILKHPSFSQSSSKLALKSEYTILTAFSCNLFILLLRVPEWNIQISGQELNWDLMKAFFVCLGLCDWQYGEEH